MPFSLSTSFGIGGFIAIAIYLVLFYKAIKSLPTGQQDFYAKLGTTRQTTVRNLIGILLFCGFFFIENFEFRVVLAVIIFVGTAWGTHLHHRFLKENGFDPLFLRKLLKISLLSALGIVLLMGSALV